MKSRILPIIVCIIALSGSSKAQEPSYRVTTKVNPPWVIEKGDDYDGFMIELIEKVARISNFTYSLKLVVDGSYGQQVNGYWDGAIGELVSDDADIAAMPMTVTETRRSAVDFSQQFLPNGHRILIKTPVVHNDPLKTLFEPYSLPLWLVVIVLSWVMAGILFLVNKLSPSEWSHVPESEDHTHARDSFEPRNAFFFVHSTMTWQGYKEMPRSPAGRIIVCMWFSFIFFMISAYIANLTAMLLARGSNQPVVPFKSFHEMAAQTLTPYGTIQNVRLINELRKSNDSVHQKILAYMNIRENNVRNINEAINKIRNSKNGYAAIVESTEAMYAASMNCDLMVVGETINPTQMAFACNQDIRGLCNELSEAIRELREAGTLYQMYNKWFRGGRCPEPNIDDYISRAETSKISARPLTIADLSLAFITLLLGLVLGAIFLLVEILVHRYKKKASNTEPVRMTDVNGRGQSEAAVDDKDDDKEQAPIAAAEP